MLPSPERGRGRVRGSAGFGNATRAAMKASFGRRAGRAVAPSPSLSPRSGERSLAYGAGGAAAGGGAAGASAGVSSLASAADGRRRVAPPTTTALGG